MTLSAFAALLLYMATVAATAAALVGAVVAILAGRSRWARAIALAAAAWLLVYAAILVTTSLASREATLAPGTVKRFCGVYLDCHLGIEVVSARWADAPGPGSARPRNGGFAVVRVRVSSNAVRASLPLTDPVVVLRDAHGAAWPRDLEAEQALAPEGGTVRPLGGELTAGASYDVDLVFDVPSDLALPRLEVTSGPWMERASELFLIGDEDSWLHAPTTLSVPWTGVATPRVS